jgi:hypothetical protein
MKKQLSEMTLRELVDHYNSLLPKEAKQAKPASFRNKDAVIEAIQALQKANKKAGHSNNGGSTRSVGNSTGEGTVRAFAEEMLKTPKAYSDILELVRKKFPDCRTSRSSLRWYASQMRGRGEKLPARPVDVGRG